MNCYGNEEREWEAVGGKGSGGRGLGVLFEVVEVRFLMNEFRNQATWWETTSLELPLWQLRDVLVGPSFCKLMGVG